MFSKRAKVLISPLLLTLFSLGLLTPSSFGAGTPNFGYFGYTWISPAIAEFEVSPPIVSETVKEYQLAASYSLSACSNQTGAAQSCSYSALETFKTLSPSSLSNYGDIIINSSTGVSTTYRSVKKFQITASEMQKFLSSKTSERNRNLAFSIRAIYGNTSTEWSDRTVATSSQIWGSSNSTSEKSVTIGYQGPLTGPEAVLGQDQLAAVRYVVANFNREYVGRYKVSIVEIDDQGDPAVAANIAPGVAQNSKILALVGPAYSGATLASLPSYKNASLGMISPSAIRESLTDPSAPAASQGSPVFHRISPLDRNQGVALYKLATAGVTSPKIFVVDDKSDYSQSLSKNVRNAITVGQLVGVDSIDTKNTDWSPTVMKSKVSGANVIIYTGYFAQAVEFAKQLRLSGFAGVFAAGDGSYTDELTTTYYSSALEDMRIVSGTAPMSVISTSLAVDMRATTGRAAGVYAAESIDATNVILYCIATGIETHKEMISCIKSFKGESIYGDDFGFDNFGDNITQRFNSLVIRNKTIQNFIPQNLQRSTNSRWWPWILPANTNNSSSNSGSSQTNNSNQSQTITPNKPSTPSFSGVNFVGNKINIAVNIGSDAASRPDKVYLVAPKLGITAANPAAGSISGSKATWSIDFDKSLGGTVIPLEVVSEKDGVKSEPVTGPFLAPDLTPSTTSVPPTPTNFKSRIVGSSAVVTAEVTIKAGALATNAYLVSKSLGITSANPLEGEVAGSKIIMEIDVKPSMAGKKYPVSIYLTNSKGNSKSLDGVVSIPKAPSAPKVPSVAPKPSAPATVICVRSSQTRTFAGTKCPPGWSNT